MKKRTVAVGCGARFVCGLRATRQVCTRARTYAFHASCWLHGLDTLFQFIRQKIQVLDPLKFHMRAFGMYYGCESLFLERIIIVISVVGGIFLIILRYPSCRDRLLEADNVSLF